MKSKFRSIVMVAAALALALGPVLPASAATRTYTSMHRSGF
jgi:hypothetical protein